MRPRTVLAALVTAFVLPACGDGPLQRSVDDTTTTAVATTETGIGDTAVETSEPDDPTDVVVAGVDFGVLDLPSGESYDEHELVVDDTGTIQVEVPTAWSDVVTTDPRDGVDDLTIGAATDIDDEGTWIPPGVWLFEWPRPGGEQDLLDEMSENLELPADCATVDTFDYDDGSYTGLAELWTGCDGTAVLLIATDVDGDYLAVAVQLVTEADIDAAIRVIETFSFTGQ